MSDETSRRSGGLRISREETLRVVGMHCATCVETVSRAAKSTPGVLEANVNLATGEARLRLAEGASLREVVRAIRRSGYDVVTQKVVLKVRISEEEAEALRRAAESVPGVVEARVNVVDGTLIAEVNPLALSASQLAEELRSRGYRAEVLSEGRLKGGARDELGYMAVRLAAAAPLTVASVVLGLVGLALPSALLAIAAVLGPGEVFHRGMIRALRNRTSNMDTLVSASSLALVAYSAYSAVALRGPTFFDAASMLVTFVLAGKTLEAYIKHRALSELPELVEYRARALRDGSVVELSSGQLRVGDLVLLGPGDVVPADGVVDDGEVLVDESVVTGEPMPVRRSKGEPLVSGSRVVNGSARLYVTRPGQRSYVNQVLEAVRAAEAARLPVQDLVDRVAAYFVPTIFAASLLTFLVSYFALGRGVEISTLLAISVLASACPCALGLATPMAVAVAVRDMARRGVLVRDGRALEALARARAFVLDKTGTVTEGRPRAEVVAELAPGAVELAAAAEAMSRHPVARAIASLGSGGQHAVSDFNEFAGQGAYARVDGHEVIVGRPDFVMSNCSGGPLQGDVLVCVDGSVAASLRVRDPVRPEARELVKYLRSRGARVIIATGDPGPSADDVARELGVELRKGLSAEEKAELVRSLRAQGPVAFVGDGVNDAEALAEADAGVAVGGGADIARLAGHIVIPSVGSLPWVIERSRMAVRKVKENLAWAFAYNAVLVPIAAGLLYPRVFLPPQLAALAMSMNSVSVVLWSLVRRL